MTNPLKSLEALQQSIWLDFISRDLIQNGQLKKYIAEDGLRGITSNPSIFEKSIAESTDYDKDILSSRKKNKSVTEIYDILTIRDVSDAADIFRPLYDKLEKNDGYVSLEVNPHLAHDTEGSIQEARRLWKLLDRPNVMIKIPATKEGIPAIQQLISEGLNINVTLLFGLERYREVADAYLSGLESRLKAQKPIDHITSVASFFLSRIDVLLDPVLTTLSKNNSEEGKIAKELQGQVAIASATNAYQIYKEIVNSSRFKNLLKQGARPQRLLWASTSTKNPAYSDVKYVEALIAPQTVNTLPEETIKAYLDHGVPKLRLETKANIDNAVDVFKQLPKLNIKIEEVTNQLEREGVDKFNQSFDKLITAIAQKVKE